jgi:L-cystine uptake protein TcyP (sodium:dicarboxylate symporter family)
MDKFTAVLTVALLAIMGIAVQNGMTDKSYTCVLMHVTPTGSTAITPVQGLATFAACEKLGDGFSQSKGSGYICVEVRK